MAEVIQNSDKNRFEYSVEGRTAVADYMLTKDNRIVLTHTEVPKQFAGQGIGSKLAKAAFAYAKENNLKVLPLCPFMASYVRSHRDEYADLLAPGFNV